LIAERSKIHNVYIGGEAYRIGYAEYRYRATYGEDRWRWTEELE